MPPAIWRPFAHGIAQSQANTKTPASYTQSAGAGASLALDLNFSFYIASHMVAASPFTPWAGLPMPGPLLLQSITVVDWWPPKMEGIVGKIRPLMLSSMPATKSFGLRR
jgi:hypothetical protein